MANSFAEVAKSMTEDYDVVDVLTILADCCVKLFGVAGAGLLLATPDGSLAVAAASSQPVQILELLEQQFNEGPCPDCYNSGEPLLNQSLMAARDRWPTFTPRALDAGFCSVHALPVRFRGQLIGALNFYCVGEAPCRSQRTVCSSTGLPAIGTIGLASASVMGYSRDPLPAARIIAFITPAAEPGGFRPRAPTAPSTRETAAPPRGGAPG